MSSCSGRYRPPVCQPRAWISTRRSLAKWMGSEDVPTIETEALLALVEAVRADHLGHAEVRRGVFGIAAAGDVEVPGAAKVVFGASAADRRVIVVAIEIDLELALAPPTGRIDAPGEVSADIVAMT